MRTRAGKGKLFLCTRLKQPRHGTTYTVKEESMTAASQNEGKGARREASPLEDILAPPGDSSTATNPVRVLTPERVEGTFNIKSRHQQRRLRHRDMGMFADAMTHGRFNEGPQVLAVSLHLRDRHHRWTQGIL